MRGTLLKDWRWEIKIEYKDYPDAILHIDSWDATDVLQAVAQALKHVQECWPYEITGIKQVEYNKLTKAKKP